MVPYGKHDRFAERILDTRYHLPWKTIVASDSIYELLRRNWVRVTRGYTGYGNPLAFEVVELNSTTKSSIVEFMAGYDPSTLILIEAGPLKSKSEYKGIVQQLVDQGVL
jgi:hypothetical protein